MRQSISPSSASKPCSPRVRKTATKWTPLFLASRIRIAGKYAVILAIAGLGMAPMVFLHFDLINVSGTDLIRVQNDFDQRARVPGGPDFEARVQREKKAAISYVKSMKNFNRTLKFSHIPKTAGTAIEHAAGEKKIPWGSCMFYHKPKVSTPL
jgi:hypothetical protein